jgi:uncharacterized protein YceK
MRILVFMAIVALAGCTNTTIDHAAAPQPGKALAFYSNSDAEYRQAAQRAEEWCHETYDAPAKYLSRRDGTVYNELTRWPESMSAAWNKTRMFPARAGVSREESASW